MKTKQNKNKTCYSYICHKACQNDKRQRHLKDILKSCIDTGPVVLTSSDTFTKKKKCLLFKGHTYISILGHSET